MDENLTITTSYGVHGDKVIVHVVDGEIQEKDLYIHFPIPMKKAWDNVIYTCSTMLLFKNEDQIEEWSKQHNIPKGDIQPISKIWEFSKEWYGKHLDPNWKKWTVKEAKELFAKYGLEHPIWKLQDDNGRF